MDDPYGIKAAIAESIEGGAWYHCDPNPSHYTNMCYNDYIYLAKVCSKWGLTRNFSLRVVEDHIELRVNMPNDSLYYPNKFLKDVSCGEYEIHYKGSDTWHHRILLSDPDAVDKIIEILDRVTLYNNECVTKIRKNRTIVAVIVFTTIMIWILAR